MLGSIKNGARRETKVQSYRPGIWTHLVHGIQRLSCQRRFVGSWRICQAVRRYYPNTEIRWPSKYGFDIIINPSEDPYQTTIFEAGSHETGMLHLMARLLDEGDVFFDVGANIGFVSLAASRMVGATGIVFAFEPHPKTFSRLQENIALNAAENVRALNLALGATAMEREVYEYPDQNIGRTSLILSNGGVSSGKAKVDTLDNTISAAGIPPAKLMKIDVEGFELSVLKGATQFLQGSGSPILIIEVDEDMPRENATDGMAMIHEFLLEQNEYELFKLAGTKWQASKLVPINDIGDVPKHDNAVYIPKWRMPLLRESALFA